MTRPVLILTSSIVFLLGAWQTGYGAWIYVKAELAQYLLARAWAQTQGGQRHVHPWPWADTWPIARLRAPQHDIEMLVLSNASGRTLAFGPGHVSSTSHPGSVGTAILNGHRDTHFRFLKHLKLGETILIENIDRETTIFTVREMHVVDARQAIIVQDESLTQLVLVTCYPFDAIEPGGPLRYIVLAERPTSALSHPLPATWDWAYGRFK
ncbi:MAG: class GN sortase [Nitrospirales bacterium]|nr:MAG: class GN sortase [Nitrospirales bacterium]